LLLKLRLLLLRLGIAGLLRYLVLRLIALLALRLLSQVAVVHVWEGAVVLLQKEENGRLKGIWSDKGGIEHGEIQRSKVGGEALIIGLRDITEPRPFKVQTFLALGMHHEVTYIVRIA
jgi:hypothetical protein